MTLAATTPTLKLLLVEDNPSDVFLLRTALIKAGLRFELSVIDDGAAALAHVDHLCTAGAKALPDVILLDLNLPKYNGLEILRTIRQYPALAGIPVAIYTSSDSPQDRSEAERLGVNCYIIKPSQLKELANVVGLVKNMGQSSRAQGSGSEP